MDQVPFGELRTKEVTELSSRSSTYDLMTVPDYWLAQYVSAGWLQPITEYRENTSLNDPEANLDDIPDEFLEANVVDGELYALPWKFNTAVLAYRTDVFDSAPQTYEDWLAGVPRAEEQGMVNVGLSLGPENAPELFLNLVVANGGEFLTEDNSAAAFNSPEGAEALEFLVELSKNSADGAVNRAWDESAQLMAQGVTASDYLISSVTNVAASGEAEGKVGFAPLVPAETSSAFMNTWGLLVPSGSANPEAAYMLMQYLVSEDIVRTMAEGGAGSVVPVREALLTDAELNEQNPAFEALREVASNASLWPQIDTLDAARQAIASPVQRAVLGQLSVEEALAQAETGVNEALNP
jgi:multiple sugar transport system substrate-binding protein